MAGEQLLFGDTPGESEPGQARDIAKELGVFYTDSQIADFLVWWSVRSPRDTILDPSFGGGVFLRSACKRLRTLGGEPSASVYGVEIDAEVHHRISAKLTDEFSVDQRNLRRGDFFDRDSSADKRVDVIVGNPPFVRYHRFSGQVRQKALRRAAAEGVRLSSLSSSWAPFVVHCSARLNRGGRLAMVLPMELMQAAYALPVLQHLSSIFHRLTLLTFKRKLFPDLNEDTLLLLAEGKAEGPAAILWRDLASAGALASLRRRGTIPLRGTRRVDAEKLTSGRQKLVEYFVPALARDLYDELRKHHWTNRLGDLADVGIGYVTGCNNYFHLTPQAVADWSIPQRFLRRAIIKSRALRGLRFTTDDWEDAVSKDHARLLLAIRSDSQLPRTVQKYIEFGEQKGVPKAYKCRSRSPWYRVPHVYQPDALLTYMSGSTPRLVANDAEAVAPNNLHVVRIHPDVHITGDGLGALWCTSLCRFSAEIEGHALGGGMLKLEPTEAQRVVVPSYPANYEALRNLATELDSLQRSGAADTALDLADTMILRVGLGLSKKECRVLRDAADLLRRRRYARGSAA
ncbi:MAG: N-6 DNA methylase [Phycisphaerae bacterium]|nr:N-6 DNA methylase [Phycisphaerae bacterium]